MDTNFKRITDAVAEMNDDQASVYILETEMELSSEVGDYICTATEECMGNSMCEASRHQNGGCYNCQCEHCCSCQVTKDEDPLYAGDGFTKWLESTCKNPEDVEKDTVEYTGMCMDPLMRMMNEAGMCQQDFV